MLPRFVAASGNSKSAVSLLKRSPFAILLTHSNNVLIVQFRDLMVVVLF